MCCVSLVLGSLFSRISVFALKNKLPFNIAFRNLYEKITNIEHNCITLETENVHDSKNYEHFGNHFIYKSI